MISGEGNRVPLFVEQAKSAADRILTVPKRHNFKDAVIVWREEGGFNCVESHWKNVQQSLAARMSCWST